MQWSQIRSPQMVFMGTFEQWQYCALFLVLPKASLGEMRRGSIVLHCFRFFYTPPPKTCTPRSTRVNRFKTLEKKVPQKSTNVCQAHLSVTSKSNRLLRLVLLLAWHCRDLSSWHPHENLQCQQQCNVEVNVSQRRPGCKHLRFMNGTVDGQVIRRTSWYREYICYIPSPSRVLMIQIGATFCHQPYLDIHLGGWLKVSPTNGSTWF